MKYVELKTNLKNGVKNAYLISGDDRYLCFDALKKIEDSLSISFKDMNAVTMSGEDVTMKEIVDSANVYPFADAFRLVVVKNFNPIKSEQKKEQLSSAAAQAKKELNDYLQSPLSSTILVFFNLDGAEFFKGIKNLETIDCSKIEPKFIEAFVKNQLAHLGIQSNNETIEKLVLYCNCDMSRVTSELDKIVAYVADTKVLTSDIVEKNVVQDKEFQVFQLAEFIAQANAKGANDLIDALVMKAGDGLMLLALLYNNYRRLLFMGINKEKSTAELAEKLGVQEYAVKMLKKQSSYFSIKQLKNIIDLISEYERKIKMGEMKENIAIKTIVLNILNIRGI